MPTAKEQLLSMMSPQAARLLDQQMRSQQVAQRSQGAGMLSGLVQAYTGMSDAFQGITSGLPMGANEMKALQAQKKRREEENELKSVAGKKRSVANVATAQFDTDPIKNIQKRIEVLSRMTVNNEFASPVIMQLEKRLEELKMNEAQIGLTQAKTASTTEGVNLTQAKTLATLKNLALTDAQIKKAEAEVAFLPEEMAIKQGQLEVSRGQLSISEMQAENQQKRIMAEALKLQAEESNLTDAVKGLSTYLKGSNIPEDRQQFYLSMVASKQFNVKDVYEMMKPLSEKELSEVALNNARASKINKEIEGGNEFKPIKSSDRSPMINALSSSGINLSNKAITDFLATGDATIIQNPVNYTISDKQFNDIKQAVDDTVGTLSKEQQNDFLLERTRLAKDSTLTPQQRAIKESEFLEKYRREAVERDYNVKNASFEAVVANMDRLSEQLNSSYQTITQQKTGKLLYALGEMINFQLPNSPERVLSNVVKTLKSNAMLETLKELKALSSTGSSGLGATNLKEVEALEAKWGALDPLSETFLEDATSVINDIKRLAEIPVMYREPNKNKTNEEITPSKQVVNVNGFKVEIGG